MNIDILAFGAHPDDVEISCGGTLLKHINAGCRVVLADLTHGELGTRGSADIRNAESAAAAQLMGVQERVKLDLRDGFFQTNEESLREVIKVIRQYKPDIILCNSPEDRHPDHGKGSKLVLEAAFLSGLPKIQTGQDAYRAKQVYHYIQDYHLNPDFVVDMSNYWDQKKKVLQCYKSQFFDPTSNEPVTPISSMEFWHFLEGRARDFGRLIQASHGEGFIAARAIGVNDFRDLR